MKWSIVGLAVLGVVAATCAFLLVASLQVRDRKSDGSGSSTAEASVSPQVQILVAAKDVAARTVLGADSVLGRTVDADKAPLGHYSDPAQVVGKVVLTALKAGQALEPTAFASDGSSLRLSSALADGMRIVSVALTDSMGLEELLNPGSVVDVLATFKLQHEDGHGEDATSVTLLQGVTVLAVGARTVVSPSGENGAGTLARGSRPNVTLLVAPEQAELLKLAVEQGSVSLALRNPMDSAAVRSDGTRSTALAPILAELSARARERARAAEADKQATREREERTHEFEMEKARYAAEKERQSIEIARMNFEKEKLDAQRALQQSSVEQPASKWESVVLRGGVAEKKSFAIGDVKPPK